MKTEEIVAAVVYSNKTDRDIIDSHIVGTSEKRLNNVAITTFFLFMCICKNYTRCFHNKQLWILVSTVVTQVTRIVC